jgi:hypothetical protein
MLFGVLVVRLVLPLHLLPGWAAPLGLIGAMVSLSVGIGCVESIIARSRLVRVPRLLLGAVLLASLGVWVMVVRA